MLRGRNRKATRSYQAWWHQTCIRLQFHWSGTCTALDASFHGVSLMGCLLYERRGKILFSMMVGKGSNHMLSLDALLNGSCTLLGQRGRHGIVHTTLPPPPARSLWTQLGVKVTFGKGEISMKYP